MAEEIGGLWPKPKERPKHRFDSAVGWCPECSTIEARDFQGFMNRLPEVRRYIDEQRNEWKYACVNCGLPYVREAEDASRVEACPWCGSTKIRKR